MMNTEPLIKHMSQYIILTDDEVTILNDRVRFRKYLKGQYLVQQGDVCRVESFVVKGCLRTFNVDEKGQEYIVAFAIENWWTGDLGSFITQSPANYNVQCLEATELLQFDHHTLQELYRVIPKLERFFRIIIERAFVAAERRIIRNFSLTAKERYLHFRTSYPEIEQRVPQYWWLLTWGLPKNS